MLNSLCNLTPPRTHSVRGAHEHGVRTRRYDASRIESRRTISLDHSFATKHVAEKMSPQKNVPPDLRKKRRAPLNRSTSAEYSKADEDVDRSESVLKGERWHRVSRAYRIPLSEYWFIFALHDMNDVHTVNPLADAQMY